MFLILDNIIVRKEGACPGLVSIVRVRVRACVRACVCVYVRVCVRVRVILNRNVSHPFVSHLDQIYIVPVLTSSHQL